MTGTRTEIHQDLGSFSYHVPFAGNTHDCFQASLIVRFFLKNGFLYSIYTSLS